MDFSFISGFYFSNEKIYLFLTLKLVINEFYKT